MLLLAKIPDEESDGEVALRSVEAFDGENESALVIELEITVAYLLVVIRVKILERGEHAEMRVLTREFLTDAEKELLIQFATRLAEVLPIHPLTDCRLGNGVL